jgi:hypothetical protein
MDWNGGPDLKYRGQRRMTRKKQYELMVENHRNLYHTTDEILRSIGMTEAHYRIAYRMHTNGYNVGNMPCMHPDGSIFYEYVEGSRRDLN